MKKDTAPADATRFAEPRTNTERDALYRRGLVEAFERSALSTFDKLSNFARFVPRQRLTLFLSKYEIMKQILAVQGSIVEVGVLNGGGLFEWLQLSEILEPRNYQRTIHGFDTFRGFPAIDRKDRHRKQSVHLKPGGLKAETYDELAENIAVYDLARALGHLPKAALHRGDLAKTARKFVADNPQLVVSLLYLDVDLYAPTRAALEAFYPRIPKGGIVAFDELNAERYPGETVAVHEYLGLGNLRIRRSPFDSFLSYAIKE